ncbi:MAG: hypothetical protein RL497_1440 [Pseudomonadota bacterium]|jgi:hypothetical protein
MNTKIILQVDGGGLLGVTPARVLAELEKQLRAKTNNNLYLRDVFNLCCGTSTGAIITGLVAAGVDAENIANFYTKDGVALFNNSKNNLLTRVFINPKFKRNDFLNVLDRVLTTSSPYKNADITLGMLPKTQSLITTAYNLCSHKTHFIKSTDADDANIKLRDVIAWSALSAAFYFGKINVPDFSWNQLDNSTPPKRTAMRGAVFQDGGQGTQNCTLDYALTEILANNWGDNGEPIIILSLGTGSPTKNTSYENAKNISDFGQAMKYIAGQARDESTTIQEMAARYVQLKRPNIKLYRLDYEAKEDYGLDDTKHMSVYTQGADSIIQSAEFTRLVSDLEAAIKQKN